MKKIIFALILCMGAISQAFAFTENFIDLSQWSVIPYNNDPTDTAHVIADPTGGSGNVLAFTGSGTALVESNASFVPGGILSFDYWGSVALGSADASFPVAPNVGGGLVGYTRGVGQVPFEYSFAANPIFGGGGNNILENHSQWIHYSFVDNSIDHLVLTQFQYNAAGADQVLFRNLSYTMPTAPVPEPKTYGLMLMGLGMIGFVRGRNKKLG